MAKDNGIMVFELLHEELVQHFHARMTHHQERAAYWTAEAVKQEQNAEGMLGEAESVSDRLGIKSSSNYGSVRTMLDHARSKVREHAKLSGQFEFYRKHMPTETSFLFSRHELSAFEFIND